MKKLALAAVLAVGAALTGCQQLQTGAADAGNVIAGAVSTVESDIALLNNKLASLAANDIPKACGIVRVAEGYFSDVANVVPAKQRQQEAQAAAAVKVICDNPPTDLKSAFTDLYNAWVAIQAATTVSGTN